MPRKKVPADIASLARLHTTRAVAVIAGIMDASHDEDTKLHAAEMLIEHGWGKANQKHQHGGADGSDAIKILIRTIVQSKDDKK